MAYGGFVISRYKLAVSLDDRVLINSKMLDNESFFQGLLMKMVIEGFGQHKIELDSESVKYIDTCLVKEYTICSRRQRYSRNSRLTKTFKDDTRNLFSIHFGHSKENTTNKSLTHFATTFKSRTSPR